jgi:hypothetical protein
MGQIVGGSKLLMIAELLPHCAERLEADPQVQP